MKPRLVPVILGPTGVGKSEVAFKLARRYRWDIVSVDSRQCYQYMEIGTAKPNPQMRNQVPHHLLDICPPDHRLSAGEFAQQAWEVIISLEKPVAVGGSGFYLKAIFEPLHTNLPSNPIIREELESLPTPTLRRKLKAEDPVTTERLHPNDRQRIVRALEVCLAARRPYSELISETSPPPPLKPYYIGLKLPKPDLLNQQAKRLDEMMGQGFLDEVRKLKDMGYPADLYAFNAYGYRELYRYLEGELSLAEAKQLILKKIKDFTKRQMTFFKTLGEVHWVEASRRLESVKAVENILRLRFPKYFS